MYKVVLVKDCYFTTVATTDDYEEAIETFILVGRANDYDTTGIKTCLFEENGIVSKCLGCYQPDDSIGNFQFTTFGSFYDDFMAICDLCI